MSYDSKFIRSSLKNLNLLKFFNPQVAYLIWNHKELGYLLFRLGRLYFCSALPSICVSPEIIQIERGNCSERF